MKEKYQPLWIQNTPRSRHCLSPERLPVISRCALAFVPCISIIAPRIFPSSPHHISGSVIVLSSLRSRWARDIRLRFFLLHTKRVWLLWTLPFLSRRFCLGGLRCRCGNSSWFRWTSFLCFSFLLHKGERWRENNTRR